MKQNKILYYVLLTLFVISIVLANVVGARVITTGLKCSWFELATSGGALTYAVTFLCTDIVGELWGKEEAKKLVQCGFIGSLFATAVIYLTGLCPAVDAGMDSAYQTLFAQNWVFVLGSLCAYYASQSWDVFVFHAIRNRFVNAGYHGEHRWIWNNVSTMTSQIIDTAIYAGISFGIGLGWAFSRDGLVALAGLMAGQYLLKLGLALLDTPIFYLLTSSRVRSRA